MVCDICGIDIADSRKDSVRLSEHCKKSYGVCGWCELRIMQYIDGNINHSIINIYWGAGHIAWHCWASIRDFIREHNITEVLEYGTGLSTELFLNEGLKVVSLDIWEQHSKLYADHQFVGKAADIIWYSDSNHLPNIDELYPGKVWDFVFVDGPQERSREVLQAMKYSSKFIMLHDPNLGEQEVFPNKDWENYRHKIWKKVDCLLEGKEK